MGAIFEVNVIVTTEAQVNEILEWLNGQETIAYDLETTGLNYRHDTVMGLGISNETTGYYIVVNTYDTVTNKLVVNEEVKLLLPKIFEKLSTKKLLMFNAAFDYRFTKFQLGYNLLLALHCDVMLLKHTCDEDYPLGLKEIGAKLYGKDVKAEKEEMQASIKANGGTTTQFYKASTEALAKYCIQDCLLTYQVFTYYREHCSNQGLSRFFYEEEVMPLLKEVVIPMEEAGIALNMPALKQAHARITFDLKMLEDSIQKAIEPYLGTFTTWFLNKDYPLKGPTSRVAKYMKVNNCSLFIAQAAVHAKDSDGSYMFNLLSKHHLKKLFFDTLKEIPTSTTELGNPQVDEEFLTAMSQKYDWVTKLIQFNKLTKLKGTYIERFLNEQEEGIFYPSFMLHRTVSGRLGGDIQQLPRTTMDEGIVGYYTNLIRSFFIPKAGNILMSADYEQLEPSIFAHVSGDNALQDIFNKGSDFYSEVAIRTERLEGFSSEKTSESYLGKLDKARRQKAKAYALGIAYGMTGYKLQYELGIPLEQADKLVEDYLKAFPKLASWMQASKQQGASQGFISTESGRIRHMPEAKRIAAKHGTSVLNSNLTLWKAYHTNDKIYKEAKQDFKIYKNLLNNAINFQIQGLAASVMNRASIEINRRLKSEQLKAKLIMQVHDELVFDVPLDEKDLVSNIVKSVMENNIKLSVPLRTMPQFGMNYAQCK